MNGTEAAREGLKLAAKRGLSAEVYYSQDRELEIRCFGGKVDHFERAEAGGLGLRVVRDGRAGSAYTELLTAEAVAETLDAAAEATEHLASQEGVALSDWPEPPQLDGLQAPEIAALATEKKIELALAAESAARAAGAEIINVPWAGYGETDSQVFLANTEGLERSGRRGSAQMFVQALAARGEERKTYFDFCFARRVADLDPGKLGRKAGETAISLLGAGQPASGRMKALFGPRAFASMLGMFFSQFSGRSAEEKRSPLAGRLGEKIGAAGLDLLDDATMAGGPASRPFDAEGVPARRLAVIEDGAFKAFLHASDTARRAGVEPTGHALRSYKGVPSIAPSNLTVPAGKASVDELRAGADLEILTITGGAGANPISGEFSLPMLGFRLKDGKRAEPLHNFTVAGSFEGMLAGVEGTGSDFEFGSPGMSAAIGCGSVLVAGLAIAGKK